MPEVYTCVCGGQGWVIYSSTHFECDVCGQEYQIPEGEILSAGDFNRQAQEYTL
jgi:hypothetical protein